MFNKSQIMKNAWQIVRTNTVKNIYGKEIKKVSMSAALKQAWAEAKKIAALVEASVFTMLIGKNEVTIDCVAGQITGNTYNAQRTLKEMFPMIKWNPAEKAWEMAEIKKAILLNIKKLMAYKLKAVNTTKTVSNTNNGFCSKCQSYCFGDCSM